MSFKSDWPPPPFYYKEYMSGPNSGRAPPMLPKDSWRVFGNIYAPSRPIEAISSDMLLYKNNKDIDLKDEFSRLFLQYAEQINTTLEAISSSRGNEIDHIKKLMKIYHNLLHILLKLRRPQGDQMIIDILKKQLDRRIEVISNLKRAISEIFKTIDVQDLPSPD